MMKTRPWLQGAGLAMLYLLPLIAIFLAPAQDGLYHQFMPVTSLTRGALLDLLLLGLLIGAALAWLPQAIVSQKSARKNKGHPPVASGRLVEMRAFGLIAVRLFQALLLGVPLLT